MDIRQSVKDTIAEFLNNDMESYFSICLISYIEEQGNAAIDAIAEVMKNKKVNLDNLEETMRSLGGMDHPPTHSKRLQLLEESLSHPLYRVRDAVSMALDALGDPHAIDALTEAASKEPMEHVRTWMLRVADELKGE